MRETYINPMYMKYDALTQPSMDIREHQHLVSMALKLNFAIIGMSMFRVLYKWM